MSPAAGLATCIIGMHRSGTSMVARLLNLGGLDLGDPAQLLDPQADNPMGFWENRDIMDLNDRLLAAKGGSWMKPPLWQVGWEAAPGMPVLLEEAAAILDLAYGGREALQWGWKDPRTTLTLPFWKRVVGPLRLVLVIRNPVDVARSLESRHGWSLTSSIHLWKQYMDTAFRHGAGTPMFVTFYDDYFQDPTCEIQQLFRFCGLSDEMDISQFQATIQQDQRHHRTDKQGVLLCRECPDEAKFMYFGVRQVKKDIQDGIIEFSSERWPFVGNGGNSAGV